MFYGEVVNTVTVDTLAEFAAALAFKVDALAAFGAAVVASAPLTAAFEVTSAGNLLAPRP